MTFTTPLALLLLLALLPIIYLGWPRLKYRRGRDIASLILRVLIMTLVTLALAGAQIVRAADKLAVVFLVDVSDSIGQDARQEQTAFINEALSAMQPDDEAAVIAFGGDALVERAMSSVREITPLRSTPFTGNTDLQEAIELALALFPPDAARRIVVLSDGLQTVGDAQAAAQRAAATGVEISYVQFQRAPAPEVQLTDVRVPPTVDAGQDFDLSVTIEAEEATPATLTIFAGGQIIHRQTVELRQGVNNYALALQAGDTGFRDFRVQVDPAEGDVFFQNNQLSTFTRVEGPPKVLLVSENDEEARYLAEALTELGLTVEQRQPDQLPGSEAGLLEYQSVVLANIPATQLSIGRMRILQRYVNRLGGGLVVVGGTESYGVGGYFQTPLEETLPLEMQLRDQQRIPQLTIAYVIDRSGSMSAVNANGVENIELAKEAIIRSIDFLQPSDRAGVVSFDTDGYWIAEVQPVFDRRGLQTLIGTLRAGGGTDILAGYRLAAEALLADPSPRKHIILLTDGGASPQGLIELSENIYQSADITTSVIAIGDRAGFLQEMAAVGGGNYHFVDLVESIPTIFTLEAVLATRSYILEEEFVPTLNMTSPIMNGITEAPPLRGYVATTPKTTAQVILNGPAPYNDPVLAQWQYGLGRVVAFTSDATSRWAADWVAWDGFARFWSQAVRWTIIEGANANLEARVVMEGEQARLIVDARTEDQADFLNGLRLQSSYSDVNGNTVPLTLRQVAPGRYEAEFTPDDEGAYIFPLSGTLPDGSVISTDPFGWVMSYSPEYNLRTNIADTALLPELAALTNGRSLRGEPAATFEHNLMAEVSLAPIAPWLLLAALLLLPFDIAVRRLLVTRSDLQRLRAAFAPRAAAAAPTAERMATLMGAKARAQQITETQSTPAAPAPAATASALRERLAQRQTESESPKPVNVPPRPPRTADAIERGSMHAKPGTREDGTLAERLLKKRQEQRGDTDEGT
jgi:uncharacterized membrane protein